MRRMSIPSRRTAGATSCGRKVAAVTAMRSMGWLFERWYTFRTASRCFGLQVK